jgi:hypothetical protein
MYNMKAKAQINELKRVWSICVQLVIGIIIHTRAEIYLIQVNQVHD